MTKKQKKSFESPADEISFLKRQNAGLKGQVGLLTAKKEDLNKYISILKEERARCENVIKGLESQVKEMSDSLAEEKRDVVRLKDELVPIKANVEHYNGLNWLVKMFTFNV